MSCNFDEKNKNTLIYYLCAEGCNTIHPNPEQKTDTTITFKLLTILESDHKEPTKIHDILQNCGSQNIFIYVSAYNTLQYMQINKNIEKEIYDKYSEYKRKIKEEYDKIMEEITLRVDIRFNEKKAEEEIKIKKINEETKSKTPPGQSFSVETNGYDISDNRAFYIQEIHKELNIDKRRIEEELKEKYLSGDEDKDLYDHEEIYKKTKIEKKANEKTKKFIDYINNSLQSYVIDKKRRLLNVVIVNLTTDSNFIIYKLNDENKNRYFKKIVNIIPKGKAVDETIANIVGEFKHGNSISVPTGINNREITYKMYEINEQTILQDTWWYKYYMETPYCFYHRLFQTSGTCWMNSILNLLVLLPPLVEILIKKFDSYRRKNEIITLGYGGYDKLKDNDDLEYMIYIIVYNLLIQQNKPNYTNADIINNIGAKVKSIYDKPTTNGDGGTSGLGLAAILNTLNLYDDISFIDFNYLSNKANIYNGAKINKDTMDKKIHYYLGTTNEEIKISDTSDNLSDLSQKIVNLGILMKENEIEIEKDMYRHKPKVLQEQLHNFLEKNKGKAKDILIVFASTTSYKVTINDYKLIGSVVNFNGHAIIGIYCVTDKQYYLYDSNNIIVQTDWSQDELKKYTDIKTKYVFQYTDCLIYMKTDVLNTKYG